jgi:hypothetical protein
VKDIDSNKNKPFAYKIQLIIIPLFPISFLLIMQKFSHNLYKIGIILLILTAMMQNIFGNINADANLKETFWGFLRIGLIILSVFAVGILIAPSLVNLGRG